MSQLKDGIQARGDAGAPEARPSSILVVGLGNPILGDDGVGWIVAAAVKDELAGRDSRVEVDSAALGGLSLMERMLGYERVILVDSMHTGDRPEGAVTVHDLDQLPAVDSGHTSSAHDTSLRTALLAAEDLGAPIPMRVHVVAIEAAASFEFSDQLTAPIAAAVPAATRKVLKLLRR